MNTKSAYVSFGKRVGFEVFYQNLEGLIADPDERERFLNEIQLPLDRIEVVPGASLYLLTFFVCNYQLYTVYIKYDYAIDTVNRLGYFGEAFIIEGYTLSLPFDIFRADEDLMESYRVKMDIAYEESYLENIQKLGGEKICRVSDINLGGKLLYLQLANTTEWSKILRDLLKSSFWEEGAKIFLFSAEKIHTTIDQYVLEQQTLEKLGNQVGNFSVRVRAWLIRNDLKPLLEKAKNCASAEAFDSIRVEFQKLLQLSSICYDTLGEEKNEIIKSYEEKALGLAQQQLQEVAIMKVRNQIAALSELITHHHSVKQPDELSGKIEELRELVNNDFSSLLGKVDELENQLLLKISENYAERDRLLGELKNKINLNKDQWGFPEKIKVIIEILEQNVAYHIDDSLILKRVQKLKAYFKDKSRYKDLDFYQVLADEFFVDIQDNRILDMTTYFVTESLKLQKEEGNIGKDLELPLKEQPFSFEEEKVYTDPLMKLEEDTYRGIEELPMDLKEELKKSDKWYSFYLKIKNILTTPMK